MSASTADLVTNSIGNLTENPSEEKTFLNMSMRERFIYIKEIITVEPVIAFYMMASTVCEPALSDLKYQKACRANLGYNDSFCDMVFENEVNYTELIKTEFDVVIGNVQSWQSPLQIVMPLLLILFLGYYSDRHQIRKPFLIVPIAGEFVAVAGCILCVIYMREWSLEILGILQTVVSSFFGGEPMVMMAAFAYIADVSTVEMRTLRFGMMQIVGNSITVITQYIAGKLSLEIGYIWTLILAAVFLAIAIIFAAFTIKEPKKPELDTKKSFLADIFDPTHALETFNLLLKKTEGNNRVLIAVIMLILFGYNFVFGGEGAVFFIYFRGIEPNLAKYSYFMATNTVIKIVGTLIALPLFTKCLKMSDFAILAVTFLNKVLANVIFALAKTIATLYVGIVSSAILGIQIIVIKSIATKVVSPNDFGKALTLFGICEAVASQGVAPYIYNQIFLNTTNLYPTVHFCFGILVYAVFIGIIIWMYCKMKSLSKQESDVKPQENFHMKDIV